MLKSELCKCTTCRAKQDCSEYQQTTAENAESAPSASTKTTSLKLPTLAEVQAHVQRELWSTDMLATSFGITERVYNYMVRQLQA